MMKKVFNNIFYLYHTFKTANELSVQVTDVLGREQPIQLLQDRMVAVREEGGCKGLCQLGAPHPCPPPLTQRG